MIVRQLTGQIYYEHISTNLNNGVILRCYTRHLRNSSERLLRMFFAPPFIITSLSSSSFLKFLVPFLPAGICLTVSVFRFHTRLDNSVSCLYFSLRREVKWFLYLFLKSLAVTSTYVCLALSSVDVTSAYKLRSLSSDSRQLGSSCTVDSCSVFCRP